jgi:threonine/homoserine/homoserine lactone efflux protein
VLSLFASAFALAIAFSAPPGAVSAEVWRRGLAGGFRPAFLVGLGSLVGDAVWALLAFVGVAFIVERDRARVVLGLFGATVLLVLAAKALAAARTPPPAGRERPRRTSLGHFATGAAISLANPYAVAFWIGAGGGLSGALDEGRIGLAVFFAGFMSGALLWTLCVAMLIGVAHRRTGPRFDRWANIVAAAMLGYFGLRLLWRTV